MVNILCSYKAVCVKAVATGSYALLFSVITISVVIIAQTRINAALQTA